MYVQRKQISVASTMVLAVALLLLPGSLQASPARPAQGEGGAWIDYTLDHRANALAAQGSILWVGTRGGLQRWDLGLGAYTKYTPADGLVGTWVYDLAVDGQGRVWVGHNRGLTVFDGVTWTTYDKDNSGIPGDEVLQVTPADNGDVWLVSGVMASDAGLGATVFDGTTWTTYTEANSDLPDDQVTSIAIDNGGSAWFGSRSGDVGEFDGATWTVHHDPTYNSKPTYAVGADDARRMWFTSPTNYAPVLMHDDAGWHHIVPDNDCGYFVRQGALDGAGQLWLTTWKGVCRYDGATWTRYHTGNSLLLSDLTHALAAGGQKVWVGYWDGSGVEPVTVSQFSGSLWDHYQRPDFLPRSFGQGIAVDQEDRKWFGLAPKGVALLDDGDWTLYDNTNSGLPDTCTVIITKDLDGHLWFAGDLCSGGLVEFDGVSWIQHSSLDPGHVPSYTVKAVAVDQGNQVWAGSVQGLSVYDGTTWTTYNTANSGLPSNDVGSVVVDKAGNIWTNCTTRFDGSAWQTFASPEAAIEAYYWDLVETFDEDFACWVADEGRGLVWRAQSTQGVKAYGSGGWLFFSDTDMGLIHPYTWRAWPMGLDLAGNLWVVAGDSNRYYGGVSRFDGSTWTAYRQADGLLEPPAFHMGVDGSNQVWFIGGAGVCAFYDPWQPTQATITPENGGVLTSADGSTVVAFPAGAVTQDTIVTLTPMPSQPSGGLVGIGHFFDLSATPAGIAAPAMDFQKPYTITVEYGDDELGPAIEGTLGLYRWNGVDWLLEPTSSVAVAQNRVSATLDHMTLFAVLGETNRLYLPLIMRGGPSRR